MHKLLRVFKTQSTKNQQLSHDRARLTRQLYKDYKGRKSVAEIKEYVDRLTSKEVEALTINKRK